MTNNSIVWFVALCCLLGFAQPACYGFSDNCPSNPNPSRQNSPYNYHVPTCNLKWVNCTTVSSGGQLIQKPPAYSLCTSSKDPSGLIPTDWYTLSIQQNPVGSGYSLHGLWPGSQYGSGSKNQPYGCLNGAEFDETYLTTFADMFNTFWPTDPKYGNTMECFILSEWMKHGTCAVIPGSDGNAYRIPQDIYYRTAMVFVNEYNLNPDFQQSLGELEPTVSVDCVQCAYFSAIEWTDNNPSNAPRMSSSCINQCYSCDTNSCTPANLDSTVEEDPNNAPQNAGNSMILEVKSDFPLDLAGGIWRSFGAEQLGSGKYEFAQLFSASSDNLNSTTDSPYATVCSDLATYVDPLNPNTEHVAMHNCGNNRHSEYCLVKRLADIGGLEVAFFACNHSGAPAPVDFQAAMNTPNCGNFLMFRCSASAPDCSFSPVTLPVTEPKKTSTVHPLHCQLRSSIDGAPSELLGTWRTLQVSQSYSVGLARWNFTSDGHATQDWPNYPDRGTRSYSVSHSTDGKVFLTDSAGNVKSCLFEFQYNHIYSYAVLACGPDNAPAPANLIDGFKQPNKQWAMGRCNGCSDFCFYSCSPQNNNCGHGSCKSLDNLTHNNNKNNGTLEQDDQWKAPDWCKPNEAGCWPTLDDIKALEQRLSPNEPRTALKWGSFPQPQPAPVPIKSFNNQSFYGLGEKGNGVKALYYYENIQDLYQPCYVGGPSPSWNNVSEMCKAALHQNEYRDWNPYIVVFVLNEQHIIDTLQFAIKHRLCISVAGTGHEYLSRNSCPTGGILIRTILLKDKQYLPSWEEYPSLAPLGAFKFGAGATFSEMHAFAGQNNLAVASGWCSTVGMVGYHLGGGHGPFAPSMGLGVDNVLEIEVLQIDYKMLGRPIVVKRTASHKHNPNLFWAMRGGGGGVWGVVLSMTLRAHAIPAGGFSRVFINPTGTFCPDDRKYGYNWLRSMWDGFADWNLMLNQQVSTQPGFFIDTSKFKQSRNLCDVTWSFSFEYLYAGGQNETNYKLYRDKLMGVLDTSSVTETNFKTAFDYLLSMPADKFTLSVNNPLPPPHPPSDSATGSQNSVFVSREAMGDGSFARTMMKVLDICVDSLFHPDPTSPDPAGYRCGFHYLYTSITGNQGSKRPSDVAISDGLRNGLMLWNARTLTTNQMQNTLYTIGQNSYFSESSYVLHDWTEHYWGQSLYQQLLAIKQAHDTHNHFWCHHCVGDNPDDPYGDPTSNDDAIIA